MALHLGEFLVGELPGFFEQRQRDAELADVVEHTRDEQRVEVILPHARQTPERHSHVGHAVEWVAVKGLHESMMCPNRVLNRMVSCGVRI